MSLLSKLNKLRHLKLIMVHVQGQLDIPSLAICCPDARELASMCISYEQMLPVFDAWRSRIDTLTVRTLPSDRDL